MNEQNEKKYAITGKGLALLAFLDIIEKGELVGAGWDAQLEEFTERIYKPIERHATVGFVCELVEEALEHRAEDPNNPSLEELDSAAAYIGAVVLGTYAELAKQEEAKDA